MPVERQGSMGLRVAAALAVVRQCGDRAALVAMEAIR